MKKILVFIIVSFAALPQVFAQQTVLISKEEVAIKVIENNSSIKISQQEFMEAKADFNQTNSVFLPNITASHTGIITTNPLMAFGSKLNQGVLTQNDFNPDLLNNPDRVQNFATVIQVQQPLMNLDGLYQRKAARASMDAMSLKRQRTEEYFSFEVEKAYMQLQLAYKGVAVLEKTEKAARANLKLAQNRFKQGYLQRADVLNVEVRVTEVQNQLQTSQSNVQNASNYLSFLMNDESYVVYKPSDSLAVQSITVKENDFSENRSDIRAMQLATNAYEAANKADKMAFLPRLNAFGSYELYDDNLFQASANGYVVGAQLSWDLFKGSQRIGQAQKSKATLEKSKLEYEQYVSQSKLELNKALRMLTDAGNKLKLSELALEQSQESLRIRTNRFKEGLEKASDLLSAETQFAQKQMEYYQTIFEFNYAQAYLHFLTKTA
ncbi:TolC family protein [Nonlabens sp. Ci31]|jgi:outer membrane protein TolC|uniref:TolC family protein n=1 Tax=Nonlabens sp. Ci31 TaxID=2608253 RepID=UPI001464478E|nr:TolC family protein [Nonlabens sp. Ci31]QJP34770.1 TolC family protein [Nonlabens sp. Ci31]